MCFWLEWGGGELDQLGTHFSEWEKLTTAWSWQKRCEKSLRRKHSGKTCASWKTIWFRKWRGFNAGIVLLATLVASFCKDVLLRKRLPSFAG